MKSKFNEMPPKRSKNGVSATLTNWAKSLGIDRQQIQRGLSRNGITTSDREELSARDIFNAVTGDKEAAMTRKLLAEAAEKERDNRLADGEILEAEEADAKLGAVVTALVQSLDSIPALVPGLTLEQRQILVAKIEEAKEKGRKECLA